VAPVKLIVDSGAGLPPGLLERHNIGVIPLMVAVGGENYQEGEISLLQITKAQREGKVVQTAAPPPGVAREVFEAAIECDGCTDILALTFPEHSSGVFESIKNGAQLLLADRPADGLHIEVVDSYSTAMGMGLLALRLAGEIAKGVSLDNAVAMAESWRHNIFVCAALETTKYADRHGRVQGLALVVNSLLKLHPTIILPPNEKPKRFGTPHRAMEAACDALVEKVAVHWPKDGRGRLSVIKTDDEGRARYVAESLSARLGVPLGEIIMAEASAVITGQAGYGAVAIAVDCGTSVGSL
jgi:DegV family protein with EDD domain